MNKLVTTLSIIGLLAASNISFAEGCDSCVPPLSGQFPNELNYTTQQLNDLAREVNNLNIDSDAIGASLVGSAWPKDAKEAGKKDKAEQGKGNAENKDPYLAFSELEREYAKSKLSLDYLYGLFLSYGERNIAITKFKNDLDYQLKICKQKEIEKNKYKNISNYEYKAYTRLLREVWEEAKEDLEDEMMELQVEDTDLRESYKIKAVEWFLQKYQPGGDGGIDGVSIGWKEQAKKKKKKCRAEKKLGKIAREFNCLNLEKLWMKDEFYGARSKIEKEGGVKDGKR